VFSAASCKIRIEVLAAIRREGSRIRVPSESTEEFYHGFFGWARIQIVYHEKHETREKMELQKNRSLQSRH
jgi:hypothetical protein